MNPPADPGYAAKDSPYFDNAREEMLPFVPAAATRLLELGCGNAGFAALLKRQRTVHVTGVEPFAAAADVAATRVDRLLRAGVEQALPLLQGELFDCIVLNDVLEHLVDPWAVLRDLRPLLAAGGALVASIPNVRYLPVLKQYLLHGQWRYQQDGVLDRTHLRFFTRPSMAAMFDESGWSVERCEGLHPIPVSWKFRGLNALAGGRLADTRFRQFACVARPAR